MAKIELKEKIEQFRTHYNSIGRVYCGILNTHVYFTSEGMRHLMYRNNRAKRNVTEQWYKINLFPLVIPVLKNADHVQGWRFTEKIIEDGIQHYALVHEVGQAKIKVRVIVKRTCDGQYNFHSVMKHDAHKKAHL
jgi:hypothetical protein